MDSSKILFIVFSVAVFILIPFFLKNVRRYYLGLACFLHIFTSGWIFYHLTGLMLADLPILTLLIYGLFSSRRTKFFFMPIALPMLGMIVLGAVSATWAKEPGWALAEVTKYIRMYLLVVCIVNNIQSVRDLRLALTCMMSGLLIEALVGIYQWQFGAVGIWFLGERPASRMDWRSMGTFFVPSFFASYLAMWLCVAFRMLVYYRPPKILSTLLYGAAGFLGFIALYTTYSRSQWLSLLAAMAVVIGISLFRSRYKIKSGWVVPLLLLFFVVFAVRYHNQILNQFGSARRVSYESRFPQYKIAERIILDRPFQGVGIGNYEMDVQRYMTEEEQNSVLQIVYIGMVHNSYLLLTAEMGFPGGLMFVLWFATILIVIFQILRSRLNHPLIINLTLGILASIIAIMIILMYSPDIHEYSILYQISLLCGILLAERNILKQAALNRHQNPLSENNVNTVSGPGA
jgi:O-antigen ligase